MDWKKIEKTSKKLDEIESIICMLSSGRSVRVALFDGSDEHSITIVISPDNTKDYILSREIQKAIQAYLDVTVRDFLSLVRQ